MILVLRYMLLLALGAGSLLVFINAAADAGLMLMASSGHRVDNPATLGVWILFAMAMFSLLSMFRFMWYAIPVMIRDWFMSHRDKFYTLLLGVVVCGIFLVT